MVTGSRGLGMSSKRAWVRVPKGPGSRGNWVTWPRYEFQKGPGQGPERAWVTVPKGPGSGSRKGLSHGPKRARLFTYFGFYTRKSNRENFKIMRNYAENARLCGNMQKITKCADMCGKQ